MQLNLGGPARGPLAGVRVIDFSAVISGPMAGQILGDMGADVIKVESPAGDTSRWMGPPFKAGLTALFTHANRNKRAITLNLKDDAARKVAHRLVAGADVVLENFRPGVAERMGIGYPELSAINPALIYVAISGFGSSGPYRDLPAYDLVIQALSGLGERQGTKEKPELVRSIVADKVTAMTAAYSAMAALYSRTQNGKGQRVDVSMMDAFSAFLLPDLMENRTFLPEEDDALPFDRADLYRCWPTQDGHVAMLVVQDDQFNGLCKALEREDLIEDERTSSLGARIANATVLFDILGEEILKWETAKLVARAREFGAPLAPLNTIDEFIADPATKEAGTVYEAEDPQAGSMRFLGSPAEFAETPMTMRSFPPRHGEDTDEVLKEVGYDDAAIAELRESGAVA